MVNSSICLSMFELPRVLTFPWTTAHSTDSLGNNMKLVSTLCFLLIARIHARNVGDPTELSLRGSEPVSDRPTEGGQAGTTPNLVAPRYERYDAGNSRCPSGLEITAAAECRVAGLSIGGTLRNGKIKSGDWDHTPCGCFIQTENPSDFAIHFDTGTDPDSCNGDSGKWTYEPVCKKSNSDGWNSKCPSGSEITTAAECEEVGLFIGGILRNGKIISGDWDHTPCGCFMQTENPSDFAIHFDTGTDPDSCNGSSRWAYEPICENNCEKATHDLLLEIGGSYKTDDATYSSKTTTNGIKHIVDDFSTNRANNLGYERACETNDGEYVELTYTATCTFGQQTVELIVGGQPRCYAKLCEEVNKQDLFLHYTLAPTAARANRARGEGSNSDAWKCTGELSSAPSTCDLETRQLNDRSEMIIAGSKIEPTVTNRKFLWIFDREEQLVTFSEDSSFVSLCTENGGTLFSMDEGNFKCGEEVSFAAQDFSICLGSSCGEEISRANAAIAAQFRQKMIDADKLEKSVLECTMSMSGALSASIGIALGAMLAVVWQLM